jgi:hypothetical protein
MGGGGVVEVKASINRSSLKYCQDLGHKHSGPKKYQKKVLKVIKVLRPKSPKSPKCPKSPKSPNKSPKKS